MPECLIFRLPLPEAEIALERANPGTADHLTLAQYWHWRDPERFSRHMEALRAAAPDPRTKAWIRASTLRITDTSGDESEAAVADLIQNVVDRPKRGDWRLALSIAGRFSSLAESEADLLQKLRPCFDRAENLEAANHAWEARFDRILILDRPEPKVPGLGERPVAELAEEFLAGTREAAFRDLGKVPEAWPLVRELARRLRENHAELSPAALARLTDLLADRDGLISQEFWAELAGGLEIRWAGAEGDRPRDAGSGDSADPL